MKMIDILNTITMEKVKIKTINTEEKKKGTIRPISK